MSDRPFVPTANKNVPQVQEPVADLGSLLTTVKSLKQGVESLGGYRGEMVSRAVTFTDLVVLGVVPPTTFNKTTGVGTGGFATNVDLQAADANLQNQINALQTPVVTFAGLPASPTVGRDAVVTDATVNTWGAAVTVGGGAMVVKVWWTGAAWTVLGRA